MAGTAVARLANLKNQQPFFMELDLFVLIYPLLLRKHIGIYIMLMIWNFQKWITHLLMRYLIHILIGEN